ncbi:hypothetical protein [Paenibacillus agricola]|uniref:YgiT-type zinc finger domain-containing protein n=1 Tax=Paenibacillus agricola TaxID=2716264 RepID=A0ABX0JHK0_9BACL|nr:hypothetical protein [Paenibacillus agricola]NHN33326.1 hypothetical protein [Paenibacillus agricola]
MQNKKAGRHKSENPRTFDLPKTRLTREERRMIELKAVMHSKGNMAEYIRDLVLKDTRIPKPLSTCLCGSTSLKIIYKDEEREVNVGDQDLTLTLTGVPRSECSTCGRIIGDMRLAAKLETVLDEEILWRVNNHHIIPKQIEFNELITITQ